jgi:hypothetical protein
MIPLAVVMLDEFGDGAPKMGLPDRNQPIEALFLNRPYEPLGVCIGVRGSDRRDDHPDSRIPQHTVDVWAPFRIAVTDQHLRRPKQFLVRVRQLTDDLAHEHCIRVGRRSENLDAPRGKIDDEHGVVGDEPTSAVSRHTFSVQAGGGGRGTII